MSSARRAMNDRLPIEITAYGRKYIEVVAGPRGTKRVVPPAGEKDAFDVPLWCRRVTVSVSPTGRSVRVFVDGKEIPR